MTEKYPYHKYYYPDRFDEDTERFERDARRFKDHYLQEFKKNYDTIKECSGILYSILWSVKKHDYNLESLSKILSKISNEKRLAYYGHTISALQNVIDSCIREHEYGLEYMQSKAKEQYDDVKEFQKAIDYLYDKLVYDKRPGGDPQDLIYTQRRISRVKSTLNEVLHDYLGNETWLYSGVIYKTLKPVGEQLKAKDDLLGIYDKIQDELLEAGCKVKNKKELDAFLAFYKKLGFPMYKLDTEKFITHQRKILSVSEKDSDLKNFDLKNTEDIKHCKKLYPLAKEYPDLFRGWYNSDKIIQFDPTYENGLEKKRKELNAKLTTKSQSAKGFKRGIIKVATKIVPENLSKRTAKIEQKIADVVYRKKQKGRK